MTPIRRERCWLTGWRVCLPTAWISLLVCKSGLPQLGQQRPAVLAGHGVDEAAEVDVGGVVGAVGNGAHQSERHVVIAADLRHCGALHLYRERVGQRPAQRIAVGAG